MATALLWINSSETQRLVCDALRSLTPDMTLDFHCCQNIETARELLQSQTLQIVIVDLSEDEVSGLAFGEEIRATSRWSRVPLIYLSQQHETTRLVRAFEVGADDVICLPVLPMELRARVGARLRLLGHQLVVHDLFWQADLRFSLATQRITYTESNGEFDLDLTPNEFKILYLLARQAGQTLTRHRILSEIWGENLHVIERTVDKHICSMRRKMGPRAHYVASVPGAGYCFNVSTTALRRETVAREQTEGSPVSDFARSNG